MGTQIFQSTDSGLVPNSNWEDRGEGGHSVSGLSCYGAWQRSGCQKHA